MHQLLVTLAGLLGLAVGLGAAGPAHAELDRARLLEASASVLKIEAARQQGGFSLGSGVVVADGLVVTNCHVTQSAVRIDVLRGDRRWRVRSQARDVGHDLCLLRVPELQAPPVRLGNSLQLQAGQPVMAVGFTGGLGLQSSSGSVVELHRLDGGRVIQSDNWFSSGASGGALFDDQLRLVGLLTFRLRGGELHYFSSPVEWLQPMLVDTQGFAPVEPEPPSSTSGSFYWQRKPPAQPAFLRAAALERDGNWAELEAMARQWSEADATDAAPWNAMARALDARGQPGEAQRALEHSVQLDPNSGPAWLQLGRMALRRGDLPQARSIRQRLQSLAPALATALVVPEGLR